jgi:hypothetical protein
MKTHTVSLSLPEYALRIVNLYTQGRLTADSIADVLSRESPSVAAYLAVAVVSYLPDSREQDVRAALARKAGYNSDPLTFNQSAPLTVQPKV